MTKLRISPDVALPLEAVTQTFAILAKRGAGKTNTSVVMMEEMLDAQLPVCIIDPVGVWWGLRSMKDGSAGYAVVILGGEHGDLPLLETAGALVADFVVGEHMPTVLDVSLFSKSAARRFMKDFCERLYQKNRDPLHLVIDEADSFIPQRVDHGMEPLVGAVNDIVRRGRARGLGVTLISQRPALINKDVLTQVECLIVLKMTGPHDRDAIERWVEYNADKDQAKTVLSSLQELEVGDAWVWSPGWLKLFKRTHIRERRTFDSSVTPEAGKRPRTPKTLAEVDLGLLQEKMAVTVAEAVKNDPKALRARVVELERALAHAEVEAAPPPLPAWVLTTLTGLYGEIAKVGQDLQALATLAEKAVRALDAGAAGKATRADESRGFFLNEAHTSHVTKTQARAERRAARELPPAPRDATPDGDGPTGPQLKLLSVLAQYPEGLDKVRLAVLLSQSHGGGGFNNNLGRLRSQGWVTKGEPIIITKAGLKFGPFEGLPTGRELLQHWLQKLGKCEGAILRTLVEVYPQPLPKDRIADRAARYNNGKPYEPNGGGFNNALGKLRTLQLITRGQDISASENLFG